MYGAILINLSSSQLKNLTNGKAINIKPKDVGSGHEIHLTATQINRIKKHVAANKGVRISLSNAELQYNKMKGGGLFSDILDSAKSIGDKVLNNPVSNALKDKFGQQASSILSNAAGQYLDNAQLLGSAYSPKDGTLSNLYNQGLSYGNSLAKGEIENLLKGLLTTQKGNGVLRSMKGRGFFDDLTSAVGQVATPLLGVAANVGERALTDALARKLAGGAIAKKRGRPRKPLMKVGNGILPPGY